MPEQLPSGDITGPRSVTEADWNVENDHGAALCSLKQTTQVGLDSKADRLEFSIAFCNDRCVAIAAVEAVQDGPLRVEY